MRLTGQSLRLTLRAATRDAHERVDRGFARFDLARPDHYRAFLQAHARALLPLETALEEAGAQALLPDWFERRRAPALIADLQELGAGPSPPPAEPPRVGGAAQVWGVLYALEGARLGGRVLARTARGSHRYLAHGEGRRFWPEFLSALEASGADPAGAAAGARLVFARFEAALEPPQLE